MLVGDHIASASYIANLPGQPPIAEEHQ